MFLLGCILAEKLLNAPLPDEVKQRCDTDKHLNRSRRTSSNIFSTAQLTFPATSREIFKYNIGVRKTLSARARYLVHMFRPTDSDLGAAFTFPRES